MSNKHLSRQCQTTVFQSVSEWLIAVKTCISNAFLNTGSINLWAINISRGNVKRVFDLTCAQNIGSLSFTPCYMHCGWSVKQLIATLLGRLTCHPMWEQNWLGGKIFWAGWSVGTSFTVYNSIYLISKVTVDNPFSRRGGSLCYVHVLKNTLLMLTSNK